MDIKVKLHSVLASPLIVILQASCLARLIPVIHKKSLNSDSGFLQYQIKTTAVNVLKKLLTHSHKFLFCIWVVVVACLLHLLSLLQKSKFSLEEL